ncbi:MAG TPA: APC family permease [Polyangia bacterium]|jgi:amino acid transporter|nr:APC family permease [Polyangia bacterium]
MEEAVKPPERSAVSLRARLRRMVFGAPRDIHDPAIFHQISLVAFLAWVGLGADGLSSSAYGPDESYRALIEKGQHGYLAVFLALATAFTVLIIASAYTRVIEEFPTGGGGYLVATKLLGNYAGVVSGSALVVDYVLTITVSVVSGGDALFNMLPLEWHGMHLHEHKVAFEVIVLLVLILLNLRGVKESVQALLPIFLIFVFTHVVLILGGVLTHLGRAHEVAGSVSSGLGRDTAAIGAWGVFALFLNAYTRGAGTYTGIEAVSNGLQIMRQPAVQTGKRTMLYMATSLAVTAGGILICYLLFQVEPVEGMTLNGVLVQSFAGGWRPFGLPLGGLFVFLTLLSEGALLLVAAQTGFIDGPRVMANMAIDSWLPHRFASLSDRLTTKDGVLLMGAGAIAVLLGTHGNLGALVVMYSVNVFVTFSLTMLGMLRHAYARRAPKWKRTMAIQSVGFVLCAAILVGMIVEKFWQGAWLTIVITTVLIIFCVSVRAHYLSIARKLRTLDEEFAHLPSHDHHGGEPEPREPTAVVLAGSYGGVGIHSILSIQRTFPGYFKNLIVVSVAVVDSGSFKGVHEMDRLHHTVEDALKKYVELARRLGWNADYRIATGTDAVAELTRLCIELSRTFPRLMFFAGKLLWKRESWYQRILHNETAYQVQRRLQWKGLPMTVLPLRVPDDRGQRGNGTV